MTTFTPIFDLDCRRCGNSPVVGIRDPDGGVLRCTSLCGTCHFSDRSMIDWQLWNEPQESTE